MKELKENTFAKRFQAFADTIDQLKAIILELEDRIEFLEKKMGLEDSVDIWIDTSTDKEEK